MHSPLCNEALICKVCSEPYNLDETLPVVLPECGHTICHPCFGSLMRRLFPSCPYDGVRITNNYLYRVPMNHSLMQILKKEREDYKELCRIHLQPLRYSCLRDKCKVCDECIILGDHKNHEAKLFTQIIQDAELKEAKLNHDIETYKQHIIDKKKITNQAQISLLRGMKERFQEVRSILDSREYEMVARVNGIIRTKTKAIDEQLQISSTLGDELTVKNEKYKKQLERREYWEIIEDDISKLNEQIEPGLLGKRLCSYAEEIDKIGNFDDIVRRELDPLVPEIECTIESMIQNNFMKNKKLKSSCSSLSNDSELHKNWMEFPSVFTFKIDKNCLIVSDRNFIRDRYINTDEREQKTKQLVNLQEWEQANFSKVKFEIRNFEALRKTENISALQLIWNWSKKIYRLQVIFSSVSDEFMISFLSALKDNLRNIRHLQICFEKCKGSNKSFNTLFQYVLPQTVEHLTLLELNLSSTCVTDGSLDTFVEKSLKHMKKLKSFALDLSNTENLTEAGIAKVFIEMQSIKTYYLHLGNMEITDFILNTFTRNTLATMKQLNSLTLCFGETEISDTSVCPLFSQLKSLKIKDLTIQLDGTEITDQSLISFIECATELSQTLKVIDISFEDTYTTTKYVKSINKLRKIYSLHENLNE